MPELIACLANNREPLYMDTEDASPTPYTISERDRIGILRVLLADVEFGMATLRVRDGEILRVPKPRIRFSEKATCAPDLSRSRRGVPSTFDAAIRRLSRRIEKLTGVWEVTVKVADGVPVIWEYEETGPPRYPDGD